MTLFVHAFANSVAKIHKKNDIRKYVCHFLWNFCYLVQFAVLFRFSFSFSSVCSLVLDYFASDAFVAGDIDHIYRCYKRCIWLGR